MTTKKQWFEADELELRQYDDVSIHLRKTIISPLPNVEVAMEVKLAPYDNDEGFQDAVETNIHLAAAAPKCAVNPPIRTSIQEVVYNLISFLYPTMATWFRSKGEEHAMKAAYATLISFVLLLSIFWGIKRGILQGWIDVLSALCVLLVWGKEGMASNQPFRLRIDALSGDYTRPPSRNKGLDDETTTAGVKKTGESLTLSRCLLYFVSKLGTERCTTVLKKIDNMISYIVINSPERVIAYWLCRSFMPTPSPTSSIDYQLFNKYPYEAIFDRSAMKIPGHGSHYAGLFGHSPFSGDVKELEKNEKLFLHADDKAAALKQNVRDSLRRMQEDFLEESPKEMSPPSSNSTASTTESTDPVTSMRRMILKWREFASSLAEAVEEGLESEALVGFEPTSLGAFFAQLLNLVVDDLQPKDIVATPKTAGLTLSNESLSNVSNSTRSDFSVQGSCICCSLPKGAEWGAEEQPRPQILKTTVEGYVFQQVVGFFLWIKWKSHRQTVEKYAYYILRALAVRGDTKLVESTLMFLLSSIETETGTDSVTPKHFVNTSYLSAALCDRTLAVTLRAKALVTDLIQRSKNKIWVTDLLVISYAQTRDLRAADQILCALYGISQPLLACSPMEMALHPALVKWDHGLGLQSWGFLLEAASKEIRRTLIYIVMLIRRWQLQPYCRNKQPLETEPVKGPKASYNGIIQWRQVQRLINRTFQNISINAKNKTIKDFKKLKHNLVTVKCKTCKTNNENTHPGISFVCRRYEGRVHHLVVLSVLVDLLETTLTVFPFSPTPVETDANPGVSFRPSPIPRISFIGLLESLVDSFREIPRQFKLLYAKKELTDCVEHRIEIPNSPRSLIVFFSAIPSANRVALAAIPGLQSLDFVAAKNKHNSSILLNLIPDDLCFDSLSRFPKSHLPPGRKVVTPHDESFLHKLCLRMVCQLEVVSRYMLPDWTKRLSASFGLAYAELNDMRLLRMPDMAGIFHKSRIPKMPCTLSCITLNTEGIGLAGELSQQFIKAVESKWEPRAPVKKPTAVDVSYPHFAVSLLQVLVRLKLYQQACNVFDAIKEASFKIPVSAMANSLVEAAIHIERNDLIRYCCYAFCPLEERTLISLVEYFLKRRQLVGALLALSSLLEERCSQGSKLDQVLVDFVIAGCELWFLHEGSLSFEGWEYDVLASKENSQLDEALCPACKVNAGLCLKAAKGVWQGQQNTALLDLAANLESGSSLVLLKTLNFRDKSHFESGFNLVLGAIKEGKIPELKYMKRIIELATDRDQIIGLLQKVICAHLAESVQCNEQRVLPGPPPRLNALCQLLTSAVASWPNCPEMELLKVSELSEKDLRPPKNNTTSSTTPSTTPWRGSSEDNLEEITTSLLLEDMAVMLLYGNVTAAARRFFMYAIPNYSSCASLGLLEIEKTCYAVVDITTAYLKQNQPHEAASFLIAALYFTYEDQKRNILHYVLDSIIHEFLTPCFVPQNE